MRKRVLSLILPLAMGLWLAVPAFAAAGTVTVEDIPASGTAVASTQAVEVDGKKIEFQMYALLDANGNGTNYVKLRDLAHVLNGTAAQFAVGYSNETGIALTAGQPYQPNGSEMNTPFSGDRAYTGGGQSVQINGQAVTMTAINLLDNQGGGYNYFKLRDLGIALGFGVDWEEGRGIVVTTQPPVQPDDDVTVEVVRLVNEERAKEGLKPLETFDTLTQAAAIRAGEIVSKFSHDRPDGSSCFTALDETGAKQGAFTCGENIAVGQTTAAEVVDAWMNSPGHRANILNRSFTHIGVGYVKTADGYRHHWVQMFVGK